MITARMRECLAFIDRYIREKGVSPSYDEICLHMGLKSKAGVTRLLISLQERGMINRLPNRARALELTSMGVAILERTLEASDEALAQRIDTRCHTDDKDANERHLDEIIINHLNDTGYPQAAEAYQLAETWRA